MDPSTFLPLNDDEIHALVDAQGSPEQLAALRTRLEHDPQAQTVVSQWQQQRAALQGLYPPLTDTPVPASLLAAALHADQVRDNAQRWWRWGGMAAGVVLAFGMGWFTHGLWGFMGSPSGRGDTQAGNGQEFVRQAVLAHAVYAPEVRHPVEVAAAQQEHLVQWLSKRVGRPIKVPNLSGQGFELVGGRLLPGDAGARAQFMFQNSAGERVTLYLGALGAADPPHQNLSRQETAFSFSSEGPVPGFYWVDHGFGYALSGTQTRAGLLQLAQAVYQQL